MVEQIDTHGLRELLRAPLGSGTHGDISTRFEALGVVEAETDGARTKAERVDVVLATLNDHDMARVAQRLLNAHGMTPSLRNRIQDALWAGQPPLVVERVRRELARELELSEAVVDTERFEALLDRWWVLGQPSLWEGLVPAPKTATRSPLDTLFPPADQLRKEIHKHVLFNPDWDTTRLFEKLGAFTATDRRFVGFIEDLASHQVLVDEGRQRRIVEAINPILRQAGIELREVDTQGGYPVFSAVHTGKLAGQPKNLIFGSFGKPDLRLANSVDNEIEVVENGTEAMVFDETISPATGLPWRSLQQWWSRLHPDQDEITAKRTLYNRLRAAIPKNSPPQQLLFDLYHKIHGDRVPDLPALLPEVWLHWDHKTVAARGAQALLGQRMDFLMLGPGHTRIVLEVDGVNHYANAAGRPSPATYARQAQHDRQLRLRGYDVYRFGGAELINPGKSLALLTEFFGALFERHNIGL
ncbi:hypothetical protein [Mycobacteroides chelonae]|uniref:AbiJ-related protein n=1 Tax=Mycobacteroides chelonae TaxID=1774 RepID=UPI000A7DC5B4|nr:hypothetical protein [Mycobacteroides chelonae]AYM40179.1 hypothetical protein DYE20_00230 [[Mycobacterium] chelonae subsp. gwanakae]